MVLIGGKSPVLRGGGIRVLVGGGRGFFPAGEVGGGTGFPL